LHVLALNTSSTQQISKLGQNTPIIPYYNKSLISLEKIKQLLSNSCPNKLRIFNFPASYKGEYTIINSKNYIEKVVKFNFPIMQEL
jgi:hypothetical protein